MNEIAPMACDLSSNPVPGDLLREVELALQEPQMVGNRLREALRQVRCLGRSAADASRNDLSQAARILAQMLAILCDAGEAEQAESRAQTEPLREFVLGQLPTLRAALENPEADLTSFVQQSHDQWGELLGLFDELSGELSRDEGDEDPGWFDTASTAENIEDDCDQATPTQEDVGLLLAAVGDPGRSPGEDDESTPPASEAVSPDTFEMDQELLEAFLDDADRCLSAMEQEALALEKEPANLQPVRQICRELHTLKGASASVNLADVAAYLHGIEDQLQKQCDDDRSVVDVQLILATVDEVRTRVRNCTGNGTHAAEPADASMPATSAAVFENSGSVGEDTIRVKASQLDRLLDMLAQLVMLRNRRDSRVAELKHTNQELASCVSRLRLIHDGMAVVRGGTAQVPYAPVSPGVNSIMEVASDVLEIGRGLRHFYEPLAEENDAVSHFIRQFRQELMHLSRVPLAGLFQRLQRSVRDAARAEQKQVRLELIGADVVLDRGLQERLYEPLLHIVRNAVSHGIEAESKRVAAGKPAEGVIRLEARGGGNLLVLEVRDDGQGLDYEAIRRRGIERGLIPADRPVTQAELARLIFQPGFSTRDGAGAVSGRGVGMDVVSSTLERMRAWVEVESTRGQGSCIRLSIPLRSVIEHTMVFRVGGQLFGIPLPLVSGATQRIDDGSSQGPSRPVVFSDLLHLTHGEEPPTQALILELAGRAVTNPTVDNSDGFSDQQGDRLRSVTLLVDEVVGPEEVVVRPLPPLLRHQSCFTGLTLSGSGEIVLLLESQYLSRLAGQAALSGDAAAQGDTTADDDAQLPPAILVADDSLSARRCLTQMLRRAGFDIVEAADGVEATELLERRPWAAIFSDLEMPRRGGFELLEEIAARSAMASLPVIMVSSRQEPEFPQRARELGAAAYLTKPVSEETLRKTLDQIGVLPQMHP
jgi:chemotaxis protein histidine kinase CheA/ActR/RegA family two-component response regulator